MADIKIEIDGDSEEAVALALLKIIMDAEGEDDVDRSWVLETYSACLATVRGALIVDDDEEDEDDMAEDDEDEEPMKS
ncbi:MAG TPA: hypothetical protein VFF61_02000 [Microvirga sp.]|nr:hypothetical protein [Microvirga sp.]